MRARPGAASRDGRDRRFSGRVVVHLLVPDPHGIAREGPLARGTEIGRFIVLSLLGRGAMGEVYAAFDPELDRKIAIKLLRGSGITGEEATPNQAQARLL